VATNFFLARLMLLINVQWDNFNTVRATNCSLLISWAYHIGVGRVAES